jgi:hypothetical protein
MNILPYRYCYAITGLQDPIVYTPHEEMPKRVLIMMRTLICVVIHVLQPKSEEKLIYWESTRRKRSGIDCEYLEAHEGRSVDLYMRGKEAGCLTSLGRMAEAGCSEGNVG